MTKDNLALKGRVTKALFDADGKIVERFTSENLIVRIGRVELAKLVAGSGTQYITMMQVGSGGTDPGTPSDPIPPSSGDTSLVDLKQTSHLSSTTENLEATNPEITFSAMFDSSVVNDVANECGLIFDDGTTLFARHTFKSIPLDAESEFSLQIQWVIEF